MYTSFHMTTKIYERVIFESKKNNSNLRCFAWKNCNVIFLRFKEIGNAIKYTPGLAPQYSALIHATPTRNSDILAMEVTVHRK